MQDEVDALAEQWLAAGMPSEAVPRLMLSKRVQRISGVLEQAYRVELGELGLTYAEFDVLATLRRGGALKPSELSRSVFLTSGGTSNVLQRLTAAGYVEREADTGDARSRWVRLTEKGAAITDRAMAASTRLHEQLLAGVPAESVQRAADALREIVLAIGTRRFR